MNRLIDELTTLAVAEFDAETRFLIRARRGRTKVNKALELLEKARR